MRLTRWVLILWQVVPLTVFSQIKTLTLADCLERARQHSYQLESSSAQVQAARAAYRSRRSSYYPYLSGEVSHAQLFYTQYNYRQQFGTAVLDWSAGDWLKKTARASAKQVEVQQAEKQQTALEIVQRVARLYIGVLRNRHELALLDERMRILDAHLQVADALWRGGVRTQLDVLQTRTAINSFREQKLALQAGTASLQAALAQLLGLAATSGLPLQDFPDAVVSLQPDSGRAKLRQNPVLLSLQRQAEVRRLQVRHVQAENLPHMQIFGGYVADGDPTAEGNYWQTGIGVQVPLFRWGETKFRQQEIAAQAQALRWQSADAQRELEIQQQQLVQQLLGLRNTFRLQQENLRILEQALQIATANYRAGLITNLEYLDAQKETLVTQVALTETRLAYVLTLVEGYVLTNEVDKIRLLQGE